MKKLIFIIILLPYITIAQNHFKPLEQTESLRTIIVDSQMLEIMANMQVNSNDTESKEYKKLLKSISSLKVFIDENGKYNIQMKKLYDSYISNNNLKEKDTKNNKIICHTKSSSRLNNISELLLFTENLNKENETIIVVIKGDFELSQAEILIKKMKIPGIKEFTNFQ